MLACVLILFSSFLSGIWKAYSSPLELKWRGWVGGLAKTEWMHLSGSDQIHPF